MSVPLNQIHKLQSPYEKQKASKPQKGQCEFVYVQMRSILKQESFSWSALFKPQKNVPKRRAKQ